MVTRPARSVIISAPHVGVVVVDVFCEDFEKGRLNLGAELPQRRVSGEVSGHKILGVRPVESPNQGSFGFQV